MSVVYSRIQYLITEFYKATREPRQIIRIGYPLIIFLLLALPSTGYARDVFTIIILLCLWNRKHYAPSTKKLLKSPILTAGFVLIVFISLSAYWSQPPFMHSPSDQIRNGIGVFLFLIGSCLYIQQEDQGIRWLFWIIGLGLLANLLGTWIDKENLFPGDRLRGYGIVNNPILLASVAVVQIVLGLHLRFSNLRAKIAEIIMLIIALGIVLLSVSRGPIMALAAVLLIWFIFIPNIKSAHKLVIFLAICGIVSVVAYIGLGDLLAKRGASFRPIIWQETIRASQEHWLIGWGWINDFSKSLPSEMIARHTGINFVHPHSLLIGALYYGGMVGLLIHLVFFGILIWQVAQSERRGFALCLLAAIVLLTMTDTYTAVTKRDFVLLIFWLPVALLIMIRRPGFR